MVRESILAAQTILSWQTMTLKTMQAGSSSATTPVKRLTTSSPANVVANNPFDCGIVMASQAFDIGTDGTLSNRRVWADLGTGVPDGICLDAHGAVWYADVPNKRCVRVREGGDVLQTVNVERGCFACMLGGPHRRTLFIVATEWRGMEKAAEVALERTGQLLTIEAPAPGAGWP